MTPGALYDDWLLAETQATLALATWRTAVRSLKSAAYTQYVHWTDAEEAAAARLCERLAQAGHSPARTGH